MGVYLKSLSLLMYDLLNCNARDMFYFDYLGKKSISVGGIVHK